MYHPRPLYSKPRFATASELHRNCALGQMTDSLSPSAMIRLTEVTAQIILSPSTFILQQHRVVCFFVCNKNSGLSANMCYEFTYWTYGPHTLCFTVYNDLLLYHCPEAAFAPMLCRLSIESAPKTDGHRYGSPRSQRVCARQVPIS